MAGVESGRHRDCHLFAESAGAQFIRMTEVDAVARVIQAVKLLPGFLRNEPTLLQPLDHLSGPAWVIHVLQGQSRLPDCQPHQGFHGRNSVHRGFPWKHHFYGAEENRYRRMSQTARLQMSLETRFCEASSFSWQKASMEYCVHSVCTVRMVPAENGSPVP